MKLLVKSAMCLAVLFAMVAVTPVQAEWSENYDDAIAQAKKEDKLVLVNFTGSDWCGWCIKLDKEVFSQEDFKKYADENLVLLKLDFPRNVPQEKEVVAQNEKLAKQYGIRGFPTIVMLNGKEKEVGRLGYVEGGPSAFIKKLESSVK